ncbi:glycosyltransferase family 2 protein [Spirosoma knui]
MHVLYSLYLIFLVYLGLSVLYLAVFAIAGRIGRADDKPLVGAPRLFRKIGVLIPAYKEDAVIADSVRVNLQQDYPADRFDLIVIADSLQPATLSELATLPIKVIPVSFEVSTVSKAINEALARIPDDVYDLLVVADADNHMAPDFLSRINVAFEQGWRAVQGHRVAKNTDTSVAILDAISEEINNHLFRKGSRALGLSSSIIGSGMAIETRLMKAAMADLRTMGGYDKELEMNIVLHGATVGYLEEAFIYDEKVANRAVFENQRTRWIAAQWQFLTNYFRRGLTEFVHGRMASTFKIVQALVLPRVLLLGVLGVCAVLGLLTGMALAWALPLILLLTLVGTLLISVPGYLWKRVTMRELLLIPVLMLNFARALFNMRKAFKSFLPTPHQAKRDVETSR